MQASVRIGTVVVVVGGLCVGAMYADQKRLARVARDMWELPINHRQARHESQRCEDLTAQQTATNQRVERKDQLSREVLAGRLSLREAAYQFRDASEGCPYSWDYLVESHPEWAIEKRCAYYVIDGVRAELKNAGQDPAFGEGASMDQAAWPDLPTNQP